jgi:hypothetical protein
MDKYALGSPGRYYNRSFSVVQSSGMGKSRLADHSAKLRFAFPFNLHEPLPVGSGGQYSPVQYSAFSFFHQHIPLLTTTSAII